MSSRGNPYDNAMAENFFSILKTECIYRTKLKIYEEARLLIEQYIHFYNNERIIYGNLGRQRRMLLFLSGIFYCNVRNG